MSKSVKEQLIVAFGALDPSKVGEIFAPTMELRFVEREVPVGDNVSKVVRILQQKHRGSLGGVSWEDIQLVKE